VAGVIVAVTCNPAIDVTYRVDRLTPGEVHRVTRAEERPGGKGVNVARVVHQLGDEVVATGLADTAFGDLVAATGVRSAFVAALPSVRRTVVVDADDSTTGFWEPGAAPCDPRAAEIELLDRVTKLLDEATGLVVSGSQPEGFDPGLSCRVAAVARDRGLPVLVDVDGPPLSAALAAGGMVLTPNLDELLRLLALPASQGALDVAAEARRLARVNRAPVVVTLGPAGMLASDGHRCWHAAAPEVDGNPTGAGDAAAAAVVRGLAAGAPWPEILPEAVALSAAAVAAPVAGEVDLGRYRKWRSAVRADVVDTLIARR
jgi:tagatose 6-phosphate kinase